VQRKTSSKSKTVRTIVTAVFFFVVVVLAMMWLAGSFHRKIDGKGVEAAAGTSGSRSRAGMTNARGFPPDAEAVAVRIKRVPRIETAVGTVRAVHETSVASKLLAKVVAVNVIAGQGVRVDDLLVKLDDADLTARLEQARSAAEADRAARDQAHVEYDRIKQLFDQGAASKIEFDRVETALKSAEANLQRAEQAVREAETTLGYAAILAPLDAVVIDKRVEAGDTVTPGQVLVTLFDPTRMQLVASVRESLTHRLAVGQMIGVRIDTLDHACDGRISEIVPEAESASRTFSVKVTGPCPPGVYSGMFGRLLIPLDDESVVLIPQSAVRRVGQLELVDVVDGGQLRRRVVKLGRSFNDEVEVLSGLREGEMVALYGNPSRDRQGADLDPRPEREGAETQGESKP